MSCGFSKRYDLGCKFCFAPFRKVTAKIVPFSVSVLAVVANKLETAICINSTAIKMIAKHVTKTLYDLDS